MRCHICNSIIENPHFNRDHGDIDPCPKCLAIIADVFGGEPDEPADEEEVEVPLTEAELLDAQRFDVV